MKWCGWLLAVLALVVLMAIGEAWEYVKLLTLKLFRPRKYKEVMELRNARRELGW